MNRSALRDAIRFERRGYTPAWVGVRRDRVSVKRSIVPIPSRIGPLAVQSNVRSFAPMVWWTVPVPLSTRTSLVMILGNPSPAGEGTKQYPSGDSDAKSQGTPAASLNLASTRPPVVWTSRTVGSRNLFHPRGSSEPGQQNELVERGAAFPQAVPIKPRFNGPVPSGARRPFCFENRRQDPSSRLPRRTLDRYDILPATCRWNSRLVSNAKSAGLIWPSQCLIASVRLEAFSFR